MATNIELYGCNVTCRQCNTLLEDISFDIKMEESTCVYETVTCHKCGEKIEVSICAQMNEE